MRAAPTASSLSRAWRWLTTVQPAGSSVGSEGESSAVAGWRGWLDRYGVSLTLAVIVAVRFALLLPEALVNVPPLNDHVLHLLALEQASTALHHGQNPTDPWLPGVVLGYPLFHSYQHLPYVLPALLSFLVGDPLPFDRLLPWIEVTLLSLFPLSVYWSMRRFGFDRLMSVCAAGLAPLLATNGLFGFDDGSYLWRGSGLYTQLWGMVLLPPALAQGYAALRDGRGYFLAVLLLVATVLSHLAFAYIAFLSLAVFTVLTPDRGVIWRRCLRLVLIGAGLALATAYFVLPLLRDSAYLNRSVFDPASKYDSYGAAWVLKALIRGDLFDYGRLPVLTALLAGGFAVCLMRWRDERYRLPVALFVLWLLLYFGRPTWGSLFDLTPLSGDLYLHRLIAGVHLGGILLIGAGIGAALRWAAARGTRMVLGAAGVTVLLLIPVCRERLDYLATNARWMRESRAAYAAERGDLDGLTATLRSAPPGRVYAGFPTNWGGRYRVGAVPLYALLNSAGLDMAGYLYHPWSLAGDPMLLFNENRPEQYALFNIRYVVVPEGQPVAPFLTFVGSFGRHRLYSAPGAGYFDLVDSRATFTAGRDTLFQPVSTWLSGGLPAAKDFPTLAFGGAPAGTPPIETAAAVLTALPPPDTTARGSVLAEQVEPNRYTALVQVERESVLLLKSTFHPNWRVEVDGRRTRPVMLMPAYPGVRLSPGSHAVRFVYEAGVERGLLLGLGIVSLAGMAALERNRRSLEQTPFWRAVRSRAAGVVQHPAVARSLHLSERLLPRVAPFAAIAVLALLAGLPLFEFKLMRGQDDYAHLPRLAEYIRALQAGEWPPRWAPNLSGGYGEPVFVFISPLFYTLGALFSAFGFGAIAALNLACFTVLLIGGTGMYLLTRDIAGRAGGLVGATAYMFAPYVLFDLYTRQALAEFSAFAWMPFALWGIERFSRAGGWRWLAVGSLGLAGVVLASNNIALLIMPVAAGLVLIVAYAGRSWRVLVRGGSVLALGLALSAWFWLPALAEQQYVHIDRFVESPRLDYHFHFLNPGDLLYIRRGFVTWLIGPVHVAAVAAGLLLLYRFHRRSTVLVNWATLGLLMSAAGVYFNLRASAPVWEKLPFLPSIQFPWQFISLIAFGSALLCALPFALLPERGRVRVPVAAAAVVALLFFSLPQAHPSGTYPITDAAYSEQGIRAISYSTDDRAFEPINVQQFPSQRPAPGRLSVRSGQAAVRAERQSGSSYDAVVDVAEPAVVRANIFAFPGWRLYVDGRRQAVDTSNPNGLMDFPLEPGVHAVQFRFGRTPVRAWSEGVSLAALILLIALPPGVRWWRTRQQSSAGTPATDEPQPETA